MKKFLMAVGAIVLIAIIAVMNFGIQIGNVRIGKQDDTLEIKQRYNIEESEFNSEYLESDKLIVVNLWATWCKPCIEEMPLLNEIKNEYADKNVEFLSLSVDTDSVKLTNFIDSGKFNFKDVTLKNLEYRTAILNYLHDKPADNKINAYYVPETYLIKNKKIVQTIQGNLESKQEFISMLEAVLD